MRRALLFLAGAAMVLGACSPRAAPKTYVVRIEQLMFGPPPAGLHVGDTIEWDNADLFEHTATATNGAFDLDMRPGAHARVVLGKAGDIDYICSLHPGMAGRLTVAP
jgi:plastocyanin